MAAPIKTLAYWSLLYRATPDKPAEFCDIRRCERRLWTATGAVKTWGEERLDEYDSVEAAGDAHIQLIAEKQSAGFTLARTHKYDPTTFDYSLLTVEVERVVELGFRSICDTHQPAEIDSFALMTDHDAMTLVCAVNAGGRQTDDARFDVFSWPHEACGDESDIAYRLILSKVRRIPFEWVDGMPPEERVTRAYHGSVEGWSHRDGVYEAFIRALESLRRKGLFAIRGGHAGFLLLMVIADSDQVAGMAERLNSPELARRFVEWTGSDCLMEINPPRW